MIRHSSRSYRSTSLVSALVLLSLATAQVGCSKREESASSSASQTSSTALGGKLSGMVGGSAPAAEAATSAAEKGTQTTPDSPTTAVQQRRVIRKADLSLESPEPDAVQAMVTSIAMARGGFVVGADTKRTAIADGKESVESTIEFRVPAATFDSTLIAIRSLPGHISSEKVTGDDVTEEYVDLEGRLAAQRALEAQYIAILKEAKSIPDILAVQQKLGEVRVDIEHAEGRRRFLENQSDLSTFKLHVTKPVEASKPAASEPEGPGFGRSIKAAGHDALDISVAIINGLIRIVGALLPIAVIFVLPLYILGRLYWRRRQRKLNPPNL